MDMDNQGRCSNPHLEFLHQLLNNSTSHQDFSLNGRIGKFIKTQINATKKLYKASLDRIEPY